MSTPELEPRSLSVLLVEDNDDDAALLERHLRKHGFLPRVTRVETAEQMETALSLPQDVILADYNLPHFSGPAALQLIRRRGLDLPFIMLSGAVTEETAVDSMRAGAHDYVSKQNPTRLVPAIERELREFKARRSRAEAEQALQASEARFHRLVDAMPIGLLIRDARGRVTYANAAIEDMLGYTAAAILAGNPPLQTLCAQLGMNFDQLTERAVEGPFEATCCRSDGTEMDVLVGVAFLNPQEAMERRELAAFLADLSHQKKSEQVLRQTEKLAVAGRLAASIAHEINNPLAAITNCLYLVAQSELTKEGRDYLQLAQGELDRVTQITVQTLRFHRQSSRPAQTDPKDLIDTVLALFESRVRRQELTIERSFRTAKTINAYEGEIRQVIVNLLGNAIDASSTGQRITLRTAALRHPRTGTAGLILTVGDRGHGMSADIASHLFEPFYSTKGVTGTGLGLWVSKEIVERHGGEIRVRSRSGEGRAAGTVFRVFLPLDGVPKAATMESALPSTLL